MSCYFIQRINKKRFTATLFLSAFLVLISCIAQNKPKNVTSSSTGQVRVQKEILENVLSIFQDKNDNYWFGTGGDGVFRYDGKTLTQYTQQDGLSNNQVQTIQQDTAGNIWFGTGIFGVTCFDGQTFKTFTNKVNTSKEWKTEPNDLWFYAGGGAYRYNNNSLTYLPLPITDLDTTYVQTPANLLSSYGVYYTLKDSKGNIWFGTQSMGVCRFDGEHFTWFAEKGLKGPAVLALFEDKKGNIWFGNNGNGLFRYDSNSLINFTEEKGLSNPEFQKSGKQGPGTLARIYTINEDSAGNLWVGTVDAGVWRYDGHTLTNYTTQDGLTGNAVNTIYKDKKGELWFGTEGEGVCKFNGTYFTKFVFK